MKKSIIAFLMAAAFIFLLAACAVMPAHDTRGTDVGELGLPRVFFGECEKVEKDSITVKVDGKYARSYGERVTVTHEELSTLEAAEGDGIRVEADSIREPSDGSGMRVVTARSAQLTSLGENHHSSALGGQEYGDYTVYKLSELSVDPDIPDFSDSSLYTKSGSGSPSGSDPLRVVEITEDKVYLAALDTTLARYVVSDVPSELFFRVGDHLYLTCEKYTYTAAGTAYYMIDEEDIKTGRVYSDTDIREVYDPTYDKITVAKPVIYLYPEQKMRCSVKLTFDGRLTTTYPEHGTEGWQNFTAYPDGTLVFDDGKEYYCLYWEGESNEQYELREGACVKGEDTAEYLERALSELGLSAREANEFIIYWLPQLEENEYNIISFIGEEYTERARLDITPAPDSILRVYMIAQAVDEYTDIPRQTFAPFEREGFCVVEWGGSILSRSARR